MKDSKRTEVLERIKELEKKGLFHEEVEINPPTITLKPEDVDYLNKKWYHRLNTKLANQIAKNYIEKLIKKKKLIIKEVIGFEKINKINSGFILTCNHFNPYDNFALHEILVPYLSKTKRRFYKVIREGNFSFKGIYGYFFRNSDTLPLSSNISTMREFNKAMDCILKRNDVVLIYPEQSMWWNYRKPRPLKTGAFKYAYKSNVPVVPCFITIDKTSIVGEDGFYIQAYTIHFFEPIYPNLNVNIKDATEELSKQNYQLWKEKYEEVYKKPLRYGEEEE